MEKPGTTLMNRRQSFGPLLAGMSMIVNSIMPGSEPDKLQPQEMIRITRELVGMAQPNFFVTKTYMPKQMDRLIIHIGQTHAPLTSDYRDIHAHEVRETLAIQQQIHALGQLWHKHHPSLGLYFEGESYTPQILSMTKKTACQFAQGWKGDIDMSEDDWRLYWSSAATLLYEQGVPINSCEDPKEYSEAVRLRKRINAGEHIDPKIIQKEIISDRDRAAVTNLAKDPYPIQALFYGYYHSLESSLKKENPTTGYIKMLPRKNEQPIPVLWGVMSPNIPIR